MCGAGGLPYLDQLGFSLVGYETCIGNSGPLPEEVAQRIDDEDLTVAEVRALEDARDQTLLTGFDTKPRSSLPP